MGDSPWSDCEQGPIPKRYTNPIPSPARSEGGNYYRFVWEDDEEADILRGAPLTTLTDLPDLGQVTGPMTPPPTPPTTPTPPTPLKPTPNDPKSQGLVYLNPPTSSRVRTEAGVVLGVTGGSVEAAYSKVSGQGHTPRDLDLDEDTHPKVTYPSKGKPLLETHSRRPRGTYVGSARGTGPAKKGDNFENTQLSLLSDDENILTQDDHDSAAPFPPDDTAAILHRPKSYQVLWPRSKRRRALIWALIIAGAMIIAGTVTYLIVHAFSSW